MAYNDKKRYYWLKLDRDFFQKYKIKSLFSEKNFEKILIIYLQLMCECVNYVDEKNNGILKFSDKRAYTLEELANVINCKPKQLDEALKVLINKELIDVLQDGTIIIYDMKVGSITGQSLRKNGGKSMVKNTNEIPQYYLINEVKTTQESESRDREEEDNNIKDFNKGFDVFENAKQVDLLLARLREGGFSENTIKDTIRVFDKLQITIKPDLFNKVFDVMNNDEIYNKEGYCFEIFRNEGVL